MELSIRGRLKVEEDLHVCGAAGPGIRGDIEVSQKRSAIGADTHKAVSLAACSGRFWPKGGLREVQAHFVDPFLERNIVAEVTLARAAIKIRIERAPDMLHRALDGRAAGRPHVRAPQLPRMVDETAACSGQNSNLVPDWWSKRQSPPERRSPIRVRV